MKTYAMGVAFVLKFVLLMQITIVNLATELATDKNSSVRAELISFVQVAYPKEGRSHWIVGKKWHGKKYCYQYFIRKFETKSRKI